MQGFNMGRYYPPDASNPPAFNTSHPLGSRARKINQGILTIRFELPFAVWCTTCKPEAIVGQGVRFNAEKKKVGSYHSTPIWSFRMKHTPCGGWWEIRTDPKNSAYVVAEGARRRDYGPDEKGGEAEGDLKFLTEEEREKRRNDAFAALEGRKGEEGLQREQKERVEELYEQSEVWKDPYTANQKLRRDFRVKRKAFQKEEKLKEGIQDKFSFGFEVADEVESDAVRAKLVDFGGKGGTSQNSTDVTNRPLFGVNNAEKKEDTKSISRKLKSTTRAEECRNGLKQSLISNTRAAVDPFLANYERPSAKQSIGILSGVKRKRIEEKKPALLTPSTTAPADVIEAENNEEAPHKKPATPAWLVNYGSDSD